MPPVQLVFATTGSFKRWGKRRIHGIFLLSSRLQHRVLVHFFQVLLTWQNPLILFSALCNVSKKSLLKWYPVPARLSFDMARYSYSVHVRSRALAHAPFGLFHFRWKVEMRKWLVNNTSVYFFSSPGLLEHDFVKKTAREKRWSARVSRLKWHEAHGRSTAVGRNAPSRTQTIILQVVYYK